MKHISAHLTRNLFALTLRTAPLALLASAFMTVPIASAQSTTSARLSGSVTDPSGAAIPNVTVVAKNVGTDFSATVTSNATGSYAFTSLPVGEYKITVTGTGFQTLIESGVTLGVSQSVTLNLPLKLGGASDTVTVTSDADLINTTTAELGQTVDSNPGATSGNFGQISGIGPVQPRVMQAAVKITF